MYTSEFLQTLLKPGKKYKGEVSGSEVVIDLTKQRKHYITIEDHHTGTDKVEVSLNKDGFAKIHLLKGR